MKKLYLFLNKHMKTLAVIWAACLLVVAVAPVMGWVVVGLIAALCVILYIGDYPCNWIQEVELSDCPGY